MILASPEQHTHDYHVSEWLDFAQECGEGKPAEDLAVAFWYDFEDTARQTDWHPYQLVHYSAGVYLGEVENIMLPRRAHWTSDVDEVTVAFWLDNCDAYADAGEEFLQDYISYHNLRCTELTSEALANHALMITHLMERDLPEFIEVYCQWNYELTDGELRHNLIDSNMATILGCVPVDELAQG